MFRKTAIGKFQYFFCRKNTNIRTLLVDGDQFRLKIFLVMVLWPFLVAGKQSCRGGDNHAEKNDNHGRDVAHSLAFSFLRMAASCTREKSLCRGFPSVSLRLSLSLSSCSTVSLCLKLLFSFPSSSFLFSISASDYFYFCKASYRSPRLYGNSWYLLPLFCLSTTISLLPFPLLSLSFRDMSLLEWVYRRKQEGCLASIPMPLEGASVSRHISAAVCK